MSCLSAARIERFLASLADTWLIAIRTAMASVSAGLLLRVLFIACLQSGASCFRAPYTSHWRRADRFDEGKRGISEKAPATTMGSRSRRLEPVREFLSQLFLGLLQAGQERRALDADDVGDGLVGEAFLPELADTLGLRHELLQTREQLIQLRFLGQHLFNKRSIIRNAVQRRATVAVLVFRFIIEGEHVTGPAELAGQAIAIAEPELILRAGTLTVCLMALTECVIVAVVLAIDFLGNLYPLMG